MRTGARRQRKRGNILVVDDQPQSAEIVGRLLQHQGYRATLAFNGAEALERLASERFDAVLCDAEMGGMSGFELLTKIRLRHLALPAILMTAFFEEEKRIVAQVSGAVTLLQKPLSAAALDGALHTTMPAMRDVAVPARRIAAEEN